MDSNQFHINLPVEQLLSRLEAEGIDIQTSTYVRVHTLLLSVPQERLSNIEELGTILRPLIVKNEEEQHKFDTVFEQYCTTILSEVDTKIKLSSVKEHLSTEDSPVKGNTGIWFLPILLSLLAIAVFCLYPFFQNKNSSKDEFDNTNETNNSFDVINCDTLPESDFIFRGIDDSGIEQEIGKPVILYNTTVRTDIPQMFKWDFGDGSSEVESDTLIVHIFERRGNYTITLTVEYENGCIVERSRDINITPIKKYDEIVELPDVLSKGLRDKIQPSEQILKPYIKYVPLIPILLLWAFIELIFFFRRTGVLDRRYFKDVLSYGEMPPFHIPFPNQDDKIHPPSEIYDLADALRQRGESDKYKLGLNDTIYHTIRNFGLPTLKFTKKSKATEYLILIQEQNANNQQVHFFNYLVSTIQKEDVNVELLLYNTDPRVCWNKDYPKGIFLRQLYGLYPSHRLIIFGDGKHFLDNFDSNVTEWANQEIRLWNERVLLTPVSLNDWSREEININSLISILPVTTNLGDTIVDALVSEQSVDIKETYQKYKNLHPQTLEEDTLKAIEKFLGKDLFLWLCCLTTYPKVQWQITLAIGKRLENEYPEFLQKDKRLLTSKNISKLVIIPFLQKGIITQELRSALYTRLQDNPTAERIARQAIYDLLEDTTVSEAAFAIREKKIEQATQKAFLKSSDKDNNRLIRYLWNNNMLDSLSQKKLDKNYTFSIRLFLLRALMILLLSLVSVLAFNNILDSTKPNDIILSDYIYKEHTIQIDSALYYNNLGVSYLENFRYDNAEISFEKALDINNEYLLPKFNLTVLKYQAGKILYGQGDFEIAASIFSLRKYKLQDSVENYMDYAAGMSYFYLKEYSIAEVYRDVILNTDPEFFNTFQPSLDDLLAQYFSQLEKKKKNKNMNIHSKEVSTETFDLASIDGNLESETEDIDNSSSISIVSSEGESERRTKYVLLLKKEISPSDNLDSFLLSQAHLRLDKKDSITNISLIKDLKNLNSLRASGLNNIQDFSPVASLLNLENLFLSDCNITDISFLSPLENLKILTLADNNITSLQAISKLEKLELLNIKGNSRLNSLDEIKNLNLKTLYLDRTQFSNSTIEEYEQLHPNTKVIFD